MKFSLVIPAHHRPESLERLLSSVVRETQEWPREDFEVILIVDGLDEQVTKEAKSRLGHLPLLILQNKEAQGAAAARNQGAAYAHGEILVFVDDDVELAQNWGTVLPSVSPDFDLLSGTVFFGNPDRPGVYPERVVRSIGGAWPLGAHLLVRRELFLQAGGFDESFAPLHNEDSELILRLLEGGAQWQRLPTLAVHHEVLWWKKPWDVVQAAKYIAVVPRFIRMYPRSIHRLPVQRWGNFLYPVPFLLLLFFPLTVWPLFLRFCLRNRHHLWRALPYFFAKWPCAIFMYRIHLWKSAWKEGIFIV